jgi:ABC-type antimicrobial peptide transport system permease subunit
MYVPQAQITDAMNAFLVRIQAVAWIVRYRDQPRALVPAIREQLRQATGLPAGEVRSMDQVVSISTARQRFNMLLMTVFGSVALLLAAIGIYGLMAYSVEQRAREIGIRLALGAEAGRVRNAVVWEGLRLALVGVVIGMALAFALARLLASFLFGVPVRDPLVFVTVPLVLTAVALLAVAVPAIRASRIDPIKALRYE